MAGVYSTRFYEGTVTAGNVASVQVPANVVWVVRSITVSAFAAGSTSVVVWGAGTPLISWGPLTPYVSGTWYGRHVMYAGENMQLQCGGANTSFYVSGYQLV